MIRARASPNLADMSWFRRALLLTLPLAATVALTVIVLAVEAAAQDWSYGLRYLPWDLSVIATVGLEVGIPVYALIGAGLLLRWGLRRPRTIGDLRDGGVGARSGVLLAVTSGMAVMIIPAVDALPQGVREIATITIQVGVPAYALIALILLLRWRLYPEPAPAMANCPAPEDAEPIREPEPASPIQLLPEPGRHLARRVERRAVELLWDETLLPPNSPDVQTVASVLDHHLPATVAAFLAVPPAGREALLSPDGRTVTQHLAAQLRLLDRTLDEVMWRGAAVQARRMVENGRRLDERLRPG